MTRDETVALFLECEAKRAEAANAAVADGKSEIEAYKTGHEAARMHWNGWAESMLAKRKALERESKWKTKITIVDFYPVLEPENQETRDWAEEASCALSNLFIVSKRRYFEHVQRSTHRKRDELQIDNDVMDFSGFNFPWSVCADYSYFTNEVRFEKCEFNGQVSMYEAEFYNRVSFESAKFITGTRFNGCVFNSRATYVFYISIGE
jgi:hypothetical protein